MTPAEAPPVPTPASLAPLQAPPTLAADGAGCVSLDFPGGPVFSGLSWRLVRAGGRAESATSTTVCATEGALDVEAAFAGGELVVRAAWTSCDGGARVELRVENRSKNAAQLSRLELATPPGGLRLPGDWRRWFVFKHGWSNAAVSASVPLGTREATLGWRAPVMPTLLRRMIVNEGARHARTAGVFESEWLSALTAPDGGRSVAFGACGFARNFTRVHLDAAAGECRIVALLDDARLEPGATRTIDPLAFVAAAEPSEALRALAQVAARTGGARVRPLRLWCTWYSGFYDRIDHRTFQESLARLKPLRPHIECVQLDDGWQRSLGDWLETNEKFPAGLAPVATAIAEAGFMPGLWTAPFAIGRSSSVYREHPDWLVRDERDRPIVAGVMPESRRVRLYHALDTTHPGALAWLRDTYAGLARMGWRLHKLDFLTAGALPGRRHDPTRTRAEAYRQGLQAIREALPADALILGGIAPLLTGTGIVDIQRVGPDTSFGRPRWRSLLQRVLRDGTTPGLRNNLAASLSRAFLNDVLWSSDCDAILGRGVSPGESRLQLAVNLLAGSSVTIGHDFRDGDFDFTGLERLAAFERGAVRVLDLAGREFPRQLAVEAAEHGRPVWLLALLNPETARARVLPLLESLAIPAGIDALELFEERPLRLQAGESVELPGHSARIFVLPRA